MRGVTAGQGPGSFRPLLEAQLELLFGDASPPCVPGKLLDEAEASLVVEVARSV
jgi:hypothetical protein